MATYLELYNLATGATANDLHNRIRVAAAIKANTIAKSTTPTAAAKAWAIEALSNPASMENTLLNYILADYNTATIATITGATDAQVQTAVNAAVDTLLGA